MGVEPQLFIEVKNSFIHVSDQVEKDDLLGLYRSRALSEYSGICKVKELELKENMTNIMESAGRCGSKETSASVSPENTLVQVEEEEARTTVMMRDIPNSYSTSRLVELFNDAGFWGTYDFVYLPIDFRTNMSLGYAFVNFVSSRDAQQFIMFFEGFSNWHFVTTKVCKVFWSDPNQGLHEHVDRYRNSPVMHENVPDDFKPRLYECGVRVAFPEPTKRIKLPRVRPAKQLKVK
jgi:hypothetical protein